MSDLRERDIRSALELVYDAAGHTGPDPFPQEFLEQLAQLIPADAVVGYHEAFIGSGGVLVESVETPHRTVPAGVSEAGGRLFWQDPLNHCRRARENRVLKLSDLLTARQRRKLDWHWLVWKPLDVEDSLRVWLPAPSGRTRTIYLERTNRCFSARDRSLLQLLRPSLIKMHTAASRRREGVETQGTRLTKRENEVLGWIAHGKTTRQIAAILVLSPHTIRKHVEHILEKLDVDSRSAAVARALRQP
jgi:DNA-binding CsgD family transcriptional regulator